jgi:hypothetical protein
MITSHDADLVSRCCPEAPPPTVYWHRELPPLDAEPVGEHSLEADGPRLPDTADNRAALWNQREESFALVVRVRIGQEVARLGGRFAHVLDEHIEIKRDAALGEAWMHGRYTYMLYR